MNNQQPNPSPPDFRPTPPPSWITYFALAILSICLVFIAFSIGTPDWSGLLINLASGIITTIIFLIIIDRKFRVNEFSFLRVRTSTFTTQIASIFSADIADTLGYAKVFSSQIHKIRPKDYIERPDLENLLEKYPNGFFMIGLGGAGKTTFAQTIAIKHSEQLIIKPKGKMIPVLIPVRNWQSGNIVEQIYKEIDKFYPVRTKVLQKWIRSKPMLLIFDGLNEHTDPDRVMMEIETLRKLATNIIVIITSRSVSNNSELPKTTMQGFAEQKIKRELDLIDDPAVSENIFENLSNPKIRFTPYFSGIIEYLWNNGSPRDVTATDLYKNLGAGAYGNYNKLRLKPWSLIENSDKPTDKKSFHLTEKGKSFAQGLVKIPEEISKSNASADWEASPKCRKISIDDVNTQ